MTRLVALASAALLLATACNQADVAPVVVSEVRLTAAPPGARMRAAYLEITNNTRETVAIDRVTSPQFGSVAIHESTVEDGIARMRPLERLVVPAGETVTLEPGGKHLMLMSPRVAEPGTVRLQFFAGDTLLVSIDVSANQEG